MNNLYKSHAPAPWPNKFRFRCSKKGAYYQVLIVSDRNGKAVIHEGFQYFDPRRLKRTLRQLNYIN